MKMSLISCRRFSFRCFANKCFADQSTRTLAVQAQSITAVSLRGIGLLSAVLFSASTLAGNFGVYDPRSQAMGGAAVAIGSVDMATGHNPALLGLYDEEEDESRNGRYFLPYAVGSISQIGIDGYEIVNDELDIQFDNALEDYNNDALRDGSLLASQTLAREVARTAADLEEALINIANKDISFSLFMPLIAVSEPSRKTGGGFYLGTRIEAGGRSTVPDEDIALFQSYINAIENVAEGGFWRDVSPELFNADESYTDFAPPPLNDPFNEITSRADIVALMINEAAVASGWGADYEGMRVAIGVTAKAMQIRIFDESRQVSGDEFEISNDSKPHMMFNADIGIALHFDNGIRVGYTGKDLFSRTFDSASGSQVKLSTKHRFGLGYIKPNWQLGIDYDIKASEPLSLEQPGRFMSLGGEYSLFKHLHLRAGYRYDSNNIIAATTSLGIGIDGLRTSTNLSYMTSSDEKGVGLQFGFAF